MDIHKLPRCISLNGVRSCSGLVRAGVLSSLPHLPQQELIVSSSLDRDLHKWSSSSYPSSVASHLFCSFHVPSSPCYDLSLFHIALALVLGLRFSSVPDLSCRKSTKASAVAMAEGRSSTPCRCSSRYTQSWRPNIKLNSLSASDMFLISSSNELNSLTKSLTDPIFFNYFNESLATPLILHGRDSRHMT